MCYFFFVVHVYPGMEYFNFHCLSKSPSASEDIRKGRMYIRIYAEGTNKAGGRDRRCAVSIICLQLGLLAGAYENLFKLVIK